MVLTTDPEKPRQQLLAQCGNRSKDAAALSAALFGYMTEQGSILESNDPKLQYDEGEKVRDTIRGTTRCRHFYIVLYLNCALKIVTHAVQLMFKTREKLCHNAAHMML